MFQSRVPINEYHDFEPYVQRTMRGEEKILTREAPPMFAVVYSAPAVGPPIFDPEIELNFAMMVHGGQEFEWGPPVVGGDEITTTTRLKDIHERDGRGYYVFESTSTNQRGERVCRGTWTNIVRGV